MTIQYDLEIIDLQERFGGPWGEHPDHAVGDWAMEAANDETRQGYWDWVANRIESADFDPDEPEMGSEDTHADNSPYPQPQD